MNLLGIGAQQPYGNLPYQIGTPEMQQPAPMAQPQGIMPQPQAAAPAQGQGGILGGLREWMTPERALAMQGIGMGLSQLANGQPADLSPVHKALTERQRAKQMRETMDAPAVAELFSPQQRAVLAQMPENMAMEIITSRMFSEPQAAAPMSPIGKLEADYRAGMIPQEVYEAEIAKMTGEPGRHQLITGEAAAAMGLDPSNAYNVGPDGRVYQIGGAGTNVDIGGVHVGSGEVGTIPPGFELFTDPNTGARSMRPIPGGPAATARDEAAAASEASERNASDYARTVTQDIGVAFEHLNAIGPMVGADGVIGANMRAARANVKGTPEYNMKGFVESALSNLTLDTMNRMRETSASGATGMGNMSDKQLKVIQGVLGQWEPGLPMEDQRFILGRLGNFYLDVQVGTQREREQAVKDGRMTAEENAEIQAMYWPETRDRIGRRLSRTDPRRRGATSADASPAPQQSGLPDEAIDILRQNPTPDFMRSFDEVFGEGAAARALGGRQ